MPFFGQNGLGLDFPDSLPSEIRGMLDRLGVDSFEPGSIIELACSSDVREHLPAGIEIRCETPEPTAAPTNAGDAL